MSLTTQKINKLRPKLMAWLTEGKPFFPNYAAEYFLSKEQASEIISRVLLALVPDDYVNERIDHLVHMVDLIAQDFSKIKI